MWLWLIGSIAYFFPSFSSQGNVWGMSDSDWLPVGWSRMRKWQRQISLEADGTSHQPDMWASVSKTCSSFTYSLCDCVCTCIYLPFLACLGYNWNHFLLCSTERWMSCSGSCGGCSGRVRSGKGRRFSLHQSPYMPPSSAEGDWVSRIQQCCHSKCMSW